MSTGWSDSASSMMRVAPIGNHWWYDRLSSWNVDSGYIVSLVGNCQGIILRLTFRGYLFTYNVKNVFQITLLSTMDGRKIIYFYNPRKIKVVYVISYAQLFHRFYISKKLQKYQVNTIYL